MQPAERCLDRVEALRAYTQGSAWFSGDEKRKGTLTPSAFADLAVLSDDYVSVPDDDISQIVSVLTMVAGRVVHASDEFAHLAPPMPRVSPDWSPVGSYRDVAVAPAAVTHSCAADGHANPARKPQHRSGSADPLGGACWAF